MDGVNIKIIEFIFDKEHFTLSLVLNLWSIFLLPLLYFIGTWVLKKIKEKKSTDKDIIPVKLKYKIAGAEIEYQIVRNFQNIEIAHKIYIELITRKAAIEIEEEKGYFRNILS